MPEGHTIHRLALDLGRDLTGHVVRASSPQGRFDAAPLDGATVTGVHAIGKHLFVDLGETRLHVHLGLFGKFRRKAPDQEPRPSVRLRLASADSVWDLTGPTACHVLDDEAFATLRERLGADPLSEGPRPASAWVRFHRSSRSVGAVLLDQSIFAGIGNVYRAELLFLLRLHPDTPARDVPKPTFERLWRLSKTLLANGVRANRIVTVPLSERRDVPRARGRQLYVYRQTTCKECGSAIARVRSAARTLYFCPTCQRGGRATGDATGEATGE